jgi:1-aminocyclopropane-1-carboxylate deaminase
MISGNKLLKLKGWLEKYDQGRCEGIITAGGPWSNHLHACAYACMLLNVPMKAIIKSNPNIQNPMIGDLRKWNVAIEFVNRADFYNDTYWQNTALEQNGLWIPMGGDGAAGEAGVTAFMNELPLPAYDYILTPVGTATTLSGIARSKLSFKKLLGFDPGTGDKLLDHKVNELNANDLSGEVRLITLKNKFGKLSTALFDCMKDWNLKTGITLDFVYTAPMCKAFVEMLEQDFFPEGSKILIVHTGGVQGNRSQPILL